ncbi:hypothetical protein [Virgibacillus kimchii]
MKKFILLFLFIAMIGLGGCYLSADDEAQKPADMDPEELPDVRAFQDEFTREFLQSAEETRDGYYPFLSGTGKYEMDFPGGGVIGERSYAVKDTGIENLVIGTKMDGGGMQIKVSYNTVRQEEYTEDLLKSFEQLVEEELDIEEKVLEDKIIYFAEYFPDSENDFYVAYIQNTMDSGGVELRISIESSVSIDQSSLLEEIKTLAESVQFVNESENVNN